MGVRPDAEPYIRFIAPLSLTLPVRSPATPIGQIGIGLYVAIVAEVADGECAAELVEILARAGNLPAVLGEPVDPAG